MPLVSRGFLAVQLAHDCVGYSSPELACEGRSLSVQASKLCPACTPCCLQFATSVMVSGWYQDDKDDAETIWYTGEGLHMLVVVCKAVCFADGVRACTCLLWFARLGA